MRISGIILHPTSLPGGYGIGDLGEWAYRFADFLSESGQGLWQVLPLGPPAEANSPYKACSSMAGNPLLISLDLLARQGLLSLEDFDTAPVFAADFVDFVPVAAFKWPLLRKAARVFFADAAAADRQEYEQFCSGERFWLDQFAEFAALRDENGGTLWTEWSRRQNPDPEDVRLHKYVQFEFFRQWQALKKYCHERRIRILGDLPFFVAQDSADVWGNPELFDLDERGHPRTVAGVPPDYFSATGQLWGNPLYRWDAMERAGYQWWIDRIRFMLEQFDLIRIDHFRGFENYYEIPAGSQNAIHGRWVDGPRDRFFEALDRVFGKLPFIAEDLGMITQEVLDLRDRWGFPGMRLLQFAFANDSPSDPFKPHNYIRNCVVYTGTHDNDTTRGWFTAPGDSTRAAEQMRAERELALLYLNSDGTEIHWDFIRAAVSSVADTAVFPLQDVLGLGSEARMNLPSRAENNWRWRFLPEQLKPEMGARLREFSRIYGRLVA
ncbi:MAG: 4-alpha-glucanotransferase [Acidobacteriota bacterium]|jgi:4-alpha-glucanotransferase